MTYVQKLCYHFDIKASDLEREIDRIFGKKIVAKSELKNMLKDKPKPVKLNTIKCVSVVLNCDYKDMLYGTEKYCGLPVRFV